MPSQYPTAPRGAQRAPVQILLAAASAATLAVTAPSLAQEANTEPSDAIADTIVALGSLSPRPAGEVGSALTVIDADALAIRQINFVSDVLRDVPGLAVNRNGPEGAQTQVRMRGAEGNHTLVFIDGIEANNPIFGEFNFANLLAADVERIEIIRGPQSALYGSEAIGGVIAVTTKGPQDGHQADAELEVGSFGSYRAFGALGHGGHQGGVRAAIQYYTTDGVSSAPASTNADGIGAGLAEDGITEDDGFTNLTASLKTVFEPTDAFRLESALRYVDSNVDIDSQEFAFGTVQDADLSNEAEDLFAKLDATLDLFDGSITTRASLGYTRSEFDSFTGETLTSSSLGERLDLGVQAGGAVQSGAVRHGLTLGVEHEQLDFTGGSLAAPNVQDDEQTSIIGEYTLDVGDALFLSGAVRQDFNDVFDDAATYRVSAAYRLGQTGTRLHASWGEGVTDPSFNERFGFNPATFIGNPELQPERSEGFDIGVEQSWLGGDLVVDITYFNADLTDEITTSFTLDTNGNFVSTPINLSGESDREGVEVAANARLFDTIMVDAQYTYLNATGADGLTEVRRPEHTASANLTWEPLPDRATLNIGVDYNGETEDLFFGFSDPNFTPRRTLDAYTTVRLAGSYRLNDSVEIFARGENVFDEDYQEVIGFAPPGAAAYAGLRITR